MNLETKKDCSSPIVGFDLKTARVTDYLKFKESLASIVKNIKRFSLLKPHIVFHFVSPLNTELALAEKAMIQEMIQSEKHWVAKLLKSLLVVASGKREMAVSIIVKDSP